MATDPLIFLVVGTSWPRKIFFEKKLASRYEKVRHTWYKDGPSIESSVALGDR